MSRIRLSRSLLIAAGICALVLGAATTRAQQYDGAQPYDQAQAYDGSDQTPGRVARLAYLAGQVQFAPAGENDWGSVGINRPMVLGDRLLTGDDGLAVLELGDSSVRIDHDSAFDFLNLAQDNVQIELSQGTLNLAVRQMDAGANFEVDTPTLAFVATTPGIYRIDNSPTGTGSMVTVFQGSGTVYGENGVSRQVAAGTSYRFNDSTLAGVDATGLPDPDDFDRFCETRDTDYQRYAQQQQYVPPDMIGGDQLAQYGQWNDTPEYGNVWYPASVPSGWAPYRYGHWAWIEPWGWTWVDDEPWGFAPFHYGRWVYVRNRWGWMPGPVHVRPVYAPALVAFIGGAGFSLSLHAGGGPVGWFPLGPRDVYVPWFHASRRYFTNVNVTNIRNVYVNRTVINNFYGDYQAGRAPRYGRHDYAYRDVAGAVTAVPRKVFVNASPVHSAVLKLDRAQLAGGEVAVRPAVNPGRASLGLRRPNPQPALLKGRKPFAHPVVARHAPAPQPVAFAAREKIIAGQHGQPPTPAQLQHLRSTNPITAARNPQVKLVSKPVTQPNAGFRNTIHPIPARNQPNQGDRPPAERAMPAQPGFHNQIHPIPAKRQPAPLRPGELPSARFRHPAQPASLPRTPALHPAPTPRQLPVVKPVERAPQTGGNQAQRQRQAELEAQQRARTQQQRQLQAQQQYQMQQRKVQEQRSIQVQQQQRAMQVQQQQQVQHTRGHAVQSAPHPRGQPAPKHHGPPSKKHPPASNE